MILFIKDLGFSVFVAAVVTLFPMFFILLNRFGVRSNQFANMNASEGYKNTCKVVLQKDKKLLLSVFIGATLFFSVFIFDMQHYSGQISGKFVSFLIQNVDPMIIKQK